MEGKNFDIWVVDTPAMLTILDKIRKPALNEFLDNKIIVVPLTVCNDVFCEMRFSLDDRFGHLRVFYKTEKVAILADALRNATFQVYEEDEGLFFCGDYSSKSTMFYPKVKFAFVLDAINLRDTVNYCNRKIELITKNACDYLGIGSGSLEKWPEIKAVESIKEVRDGVFCCEFY